MKIEINHSSKKFDSFRANKVRSLFNAESAHVWSHTADIPVEGGDWQVGLVVGPSGSGKTSIGSRVFEGVDIHSLYGGWKSDSPIVDEIAPEKNLSEVTGALSSVGLGDVPAWLRPFSALSNGEQYRAGLARLIVSELEKVVVDEFTSVVDRQIAKVGASAFVKSWRKRRGRQVVLLSCHYDIIPWLQPDWVYDTRTGLVKKKSKNALPLNFKFGRSTAVTGSILKSIII